MLNFQSCLISVIGYEVCVFVGELCAGEKGGKMCDGADGRTAG